MSLRYGILGLLNRTPMTGYNLKKLFDQTLSNVWTASLSQIYRELVMLEKDGLVLSQIQEQDDKPDKKVYTITGEGKVSLQAWLMQNPESYVSPKRDEFMLRLFFGSSMGADHVKGQLSLFIKDREKAYEQMEKDVLRFRKLAMDSKDGSIISTDEKKYVRFIIRRSQLTNQLLIDWAQACIRELEETQS